MTIDALWPAHERQALIDSVGQVIVLVGGPTIVNISGRYLLESFAIDSHTRIGVAEVFRCGPDQGPPAAVITVPTWALVEFERSGFRR